MTGEKKKKDLEQFSKKNNTSLCSRLLWEISFIFPRKIKQEKKEKLSHFV